MSELVSCVISVILARDSHHWGQVTTLWSQVSLCVYSLSTSGAGGKTCLHSNNQRLKYQALKERVFSEAYKQKHKRNTRSFPKFCHCRTMPVIYLFVLLRNSEGVDTCEYLTIRYPFAHLCNTHKQLFTVTQSL